MQYNDIINGGNIPQGAVIQNNGTVLVQSQDGSVYLVGRILTQGNSKTFHQDSSATLVSQPPSAQPQVNGFGYQQPPQYPNMNVPRQDFRAPQQVYGQPNISGASNCHVVGSSSSRRRANKTSEQIKTKAVIPISYPTISNDVCPELHVSDLIVRLKEVEDDMKAYINGALLAKAEVSINLTKRFVDEVLKSESSMYMSESEAVDEWVVRNINKLGEVIGLKILEPSDIGEIKKRLKTDEDLHKLWQSFMTNAFTDDDGVITAYDLDSVVVTNASGCTSELYDIRSLQEIEIPDGSCVSRLVARYKPSIIVTPDYTFDVFNGATIRIRSRIG